MLCFVSCFGLEELESFEEGWKRIFQRQKWLYNVIYNMLIIEKLSILLFMG